MTIEKVADLIREVAETVVLPRWRNLAEGDVTRKANQGGLVTIADHEAEAMFKARLPALLPGSRVIGEEGVAADPGLLRGFEDDGPLWVVDPIDGTRAFAEGLPSFDIMVALVRGKRPVAGWIYAPAERDFYMGEVGSGVIRQQGDAPASALRAPRTGPLADLHGIVSPGAFRNRGLPDPQARAQCFAGFVRHVCAGHNYARLLRGESQFMLNFSTYSWDHLPGLALVGAIGFHHARLDGQPFEPADRAGGLLIAPDEPSWGEIHRVLLPPGAVAQAARRGL